MKRLGVVSVLVRLRENCQPENCQSENYQSVGLSLEVGQSLAGQIIGLTQVALIVAFVMSVGHFAAAAGSVLEQSLALQGQPLPAGEP